MCGICGKIDFSGRPVNRFLIEKMNDMLVHRGPDASGVFVRSDDDLPAVGLGHRRLKVIDLSDSANQPMTNEDGTIQIVFNGEIYNFEELRQELIGKGHSFRSRSDTETVIHLYEEEGVGCLKRLRGPFAFAIWDKGRSRLFLARDRIGKKPLYYAAVGRSLLFASELKAILQDEAVPRSVDMNAIDLFLTYLCVPSPLTILRSVKKLPPAHYMVYDRRGATVQRYWQLDFRKKTTLKEKDCANQVLELLQEATRLRMVSDVPLGAFLSGGIDSSTVVALMSRMSPQRIKTFSIGFEEGSYNETHFARLVADTFQTEHRTFIVKPDILQILPGLIWHYGEPYSDSSAIASFYLAQKTAEEVVVALNGDGGDENFAGYERYLAGRMADTYQSLPFFLRRAILKPLIDFLPGEATRKNRIYRIKRFLEAADKDALTRHYMWVSGFADRDKEALFTDSTKQALTAGGAYAYLEDIYQNAQLPDLVDRLLWTDIHSNLPEDLCVKMDIATMAHSLEGRSPFLDHRFMEYTAQIPSALKIKGRTLKYILKRALTGIVPDAVLRRPKMGFGVPLNYWFRGKLKNLAVSVLLDQKTIGRNYFKKEALETLLARHIKGAHDYSYHIWSLITLELWHRMFLDEGPSGQKEALADLGELRPAGME
ncbi:MAG: asparagine synthase (glutamine-hydrolyzing) [Candidatus Omnitrophica bacterium]|nr:asparagine synthase (glutamine-hydrolyzing) [Candidatus Omnitrophota bacterium]